MVHGEETFKWFLASLLFGARTSEGIAIKTYREFEREGILSPEDILNKGWDGLVEILDRGGYVGIGYYGGKGISGLFRTLLKKTARFLIS